MANSRIRAILPEINGVVDDRSAEGAVRTRIVKGDLVVMPFREFHNVAESTGAGTGVGYQEGLLTESEAGVGTGINVTVQASDFVGTGHGVRIWQPFYGPVFGVSMKREGATPNVVSLGVDGEYFGVEPYHPILTSRNQQFVTDDCIAVVVDDLDDPLAYGRGHMGEIVLTSQAGAISSVTLFGFVVSRAAGYRPPDRLLFPVTTTLTTSAVALYKGASGAAKGRSIRKVCYFNADSVTRTILIKLGSTQIYPTITLAAGAGQEVDFSQLAATPTTVTHQTGEGNTTTSVRATSWVGV